MKNATLRLMVAALPFSFMAKLAEGPLGLAPFIGLLAGVAGSELVMARAARQCRRPSDRAGRSVLQRMNASHAAVTQWGLSHVAIGEDLTILDVGCGGGQTVDRLASIATRGKVYGVDYSEASLAMARDLNRRPITPRPLHIKHA